MSAERKLMMRRYNYLKLPQEVISIMFPNEKKTFFNNKVKMNKKSKTRSKREKIAY